MQCLPRLTLLAVTLLPLAAQATLQPGHLDPTFGVEGKRIVGASLPGGSQRGPARLLEGPEGRLYLVGNVERADASVAVAIARLSPDGAIDTGFGDGGLLEFVPDGVSNAAAYGAVFDAQQRLIVVGEADLGGRHALVCRFDADGAVDLAFGTPATPGCIVEPLGMQDWANDVLVQPCPVPDQCVDGTRIVVAGTRVDAGNVRRGVVAAFRADGLGLTAFGTLGLAHVTAEMSGSPNELVSIAQNATGALVATGWMDRSPGDFDFSVLRLRPEGEPELAFASDGYSAMAFDLGGVEFGRDVASSVHLGDDEAVWIAGHAQRDSLSYRPALVKLEPDGSGSVEFDGAIPNGFGGLSYDLCGPICDARFTDMTLLPDGRILLAGSIAQGDDDDDDTDLGAKNDTFAMRVLPDGTPDPSFGAPGSAQDGLSVIDHGAVLGNSDDVATSLLLQDKKILVAGYARAADPNTDDEILDFYDFALARIGGGDPIFSDSFE